MLTSIVIFAISLTAGLVATVVSMGSETAAEVLDPDVEKRWLVRRLARFPAIAAFLGRRLDRRQAGGLMLTMGTAVVLGLAVATGVLFDMVDDQTGFAAFDSAVAEFGAANAGSVAAEIQSAFTRLGGGLAISIAGVVAGAWGWWRYDNFHVAMFMLTVILGQAILSTGLKGLVGRERPELAQLAPFSGSSFPSGHAAAAAAVYTAVGLVLTLRASRRARAIASGLAALVAFGVAATRAMLGVHWLTDVLAGLAVGFAWFIVAAVVFGGKIMHFGETSEEIATRSSG